MSSLSFQLVKQSKLRKNRTKKHKNNKNVKSKVHFPRWWTGPLTQEEVREGQNLFKVCLSWSVISWSGSEPRSVKLGNLCLGKGWAEFLSSKL